MTENPEIASLRKRRDRERSLDKLEFGLRVGRLEFMPSCTYCGVSPSKMRQDIRNGVAPPFFQVGAKRIFLVRDLDAWLEARRVEPTPGPAIRVRSVA